MLRDAGGAGGCCGAGQPPPALRQDQPSGFCLDREKEKKRKQNKHAGFFRRLRLRICFSTAAGAGLVLLSHVTWCFHGQVVMTSCGCFANVLPWLSAILQTSRRRTR